MRDNLCRNRVLVVGHYRVGDFHSRLGKVNQPQRMYHAWQQQVHNIAIYMMQTVMSLSL